MDSLPHDQIPVVEKLGEKLLPIVWCFHQYLFKVVRLEIYNTALFISINETDEELLDNLRVSFPHGSVAEELVGHLKQNGPSHGGRAVWHFDQGGCFVRIYEKLDSPYRLAVLLHEFFHATTLILYAKGVTFAEPSEEAFTYLHEYLCREFFHALLSQPVYIDHPAPALDSV